jgi:Site-specific recombinase XerD
MFEQMFGVKKVSKDKRAKAAKGTGKIYQRADGYWTCSWTAALPDGTSKRIVLTAKEEADVVIKKNAKIAELERGEYVGRDGITFEVWSTKWLEECKKIELSPNTYEVYKIDLAHLNKTIGKLKLQKITSEILQRCINNLARTLAPATVKKICAIMKQCFTYAVQNKRIKFSPAQYVKTPKTVMVKKKNALSAAKLKALLNAAKNDSAHHLNPTYYPALLLLVETGCRRSEVLGLKWKNVDIRNNTILICDAIIEVNGKAYPKEEPKNHSSIRMLPISKTTMSAIGAIKDVKGKCEYVFHTDQGKPINPRSFNGKFALWCHKAKLWVGNWTGVWNDDKKTGRPSHTPHELRHTFITDMIDAGESITTIQSLTGHATPRVLVRYAHKVPESAARAIEKRKSRLYKIMPGETK